MDRIPEQTAGSPVPQITEVIVDRIFEQTVGSPVPQITEEIVDRIPEQTVGSPVPQITEEIVDRFLEQTVGSPVPQITEEIVDRIPEQTVGSAVPQITEEILDSVPGSVCDTPLQRIWCIFEEVGSASVEQIVDVPVPHDTGIIGGVQVNDEFRGWNKESRLAALSRLIADREALLLSGRLNGTVHEKRVRYSIVGCRREIESLDSFSPLDQRCIVETMLADLEQDSDFS